MELPLDPGITLRDLQQLHRLLVNCGAPIDLRQDTVCPYCRSPLAILDPDAVVKALGELNTAEIQRKTIDIDRLADALLMRPPDSLSSRAGAPADAKPVGTGDLVAAGIALVAALLR